MRPATLYSLALVRAHRGQVQQARELASEALALCDRTGNIPVRSMVLSVLGFIAHSRSTTTRPRTLHLGRLAEVAAVVGLGEPSVVKFLPDEIEALAVLGEVDLAWSFTRQLEAQGKSLGRPWALATAARCRAHLAARTATSKEPGPLVSRRCHSMSGCRCRSSWDGPCSSRA